MGQTQSGASSSAATNSTALWGDWIDRSKGLLEVREESYSVFLFSHWSSFFTDLPWLLGLRRYAFCCRVGHSLFVFYCLFVAYTSPSFWSSGRSQLASSQTYSPVESLSRAATRDEAPGDGSSSATTIFVFRSESEKKK